jgi:hypothetical protein
MRRIWILQVLIFLLAAIPAPRAMAIVAADIAANHPSAVAAASAAGNGQAATDNLSKAAAPADDKFSGFGFSPALVTMFGLDTVSTAQLAGTPKVVRVTKDNGTRVGLGLESHYFFTPALHFLCIPKLGPDTWGFGPYVGLTVGTDNVIETVGTGLLLGFRRDAVGKTASDGSVTSKASADSFNLGVGVVIDPNAQVLGKGFQANQPPPNGEDQVRFLTTTKVGVGLMFSYYFNPL